MERETEAKLLQRIAEELPALPEGSIWDKYGKIRIYFNFGNRRKDEDYSFYADLNTLPFSLVDFNKRYWLPQMVVSSEIEISKTIESIYYELIHPLTEKLPISTIYEMKIHRRFESTLPVNNIEEDEKLTVKPIPLEIELEVEKSYFENIFQTGRKDKNNNPIYRFVMDYDQLEELLNKFKEIEDDQDDAFMKELMRKTYGKKK